MTTAPAPAVRQNNKALHIALWVLQALLALAFVGAGVMKLTSPIADLHEKMAWTLTFSDGMVRFVGLAELLGGIGLILPAATRILPVLTGIAAAALTLVMVLGAGWHVTNNDVAHIAPAVVLALLAAVVAWGRLKAAPITPRS